MSKKLTKIRVVPIMSGSKLQWVIKDGQTVLGTFFTREHADKQKILIENQQNNLFNK